MRTIARAVIGVLLVVLGALSPSLIAQRIDGGVRLNGITQGITIASPTLTGTVNIGNTAAAPSLIVSATAVTSGVPVLLPNGTVGAPGVAFAIEPRTGLVRLSNGNMGWSQVGTLVGWMDSLNPQYAFVLGSTSTLGWSTSGAGTATADIQLWRSAAKTLRLDTDGAGGALTLVDVKGPLTASGSLTGAGLNAGGSGHFTWSGRTDLAAPLDGQLSITNNAVTAGALWDYTTDATAQLKTRAGADTAILKANVVNPTGTYQVNGALAISATAPTVTAGFGSGVAGTVTKNTGTMIVQVTVGTNAGGTTGTLTFPSAPTGWACTLSDVTTTTDLTRQTGFTQTTAAFSTTVAWTTGDVLVGVCGPF